MARAPVLAAGGIVTQRGGSPLIAVVRLRKRNDWVLPKGKLDEGETPRAAAEREVLEETGHLVSVHEFLGTLAYENGGRAKVVHYWRMEADREQTHELMDDIKAVAWLPLDEALQRLTRFHERAFLAQVGPLALEAAATRAAPRRPPAKRSAAPSRPAARPAPAPTSAAPPPAAANDGQVPPAPADAVETPAPPAAEPAEAIAPTANAAATSDAAATEQAENAAEAVNAADAADIADIADAAEAADADSTAAANAGDIAQAAEREEAADIEAAASIEEADSPALAPEPFAREFPVAPHAVERSRTLLEKALLWLRGKA